jgi:8-hydroxy-5-deazaflavin:NADPH oxidoreductase
VSKAFVGARLVKAFNHLPAKQLGTNPAVKGQRQAVFVSSNDAHAAQLLRPWRLSLASLQSNSEGSIHAAYPFTFWAASLSGLLLQNLVKLG